MSKHKVTEEAAEKAIAAILPWEKMKKIDQLPDLGGDIDDILGDL
jgi:hypothetical protein